MPMISFRVLAVATLPLVLACAASPDSGPSGTGGRTGTGGAVTPGNGGTMAGTGGSTAPGSGGMNPAAGPGCGMGRKAPTGTLIENFDGMTQVLEWRTADMTNYTGAAATPMGQFMVPVTGPETHAVAALASWSAVDRPCLDGSSYTGIQFKLSGTVSNLLVRIGTPATFPAPGVVKPDHIGDGGICMSNTDCAYAHYQKDVSASVAAGGTVQVAFADLVAPYGKPAPFDKSALVSLIFLTLDPDKTKSFTIDDISFY